MATVNYSTRVEDGTKTAPSYSFRQDTDTGVYRIGANNLGISVGDTKIFDATATLVTVPVDTYFSAGTKFAFSSTDVESLGASMASVTLGARAYMTFGTTFNKSFALAQGAYYDGTWKYKAGGEPACLVDLDGSTGALALKVAASGSADAAITWVSALSAASTGVTTFSKSITITTSDNTALIAQANSGIEAQVTTYDDTPTTSCGEFNARRTRGTIAVPGSIMDEDIMGRFGVSGRDSAGVWDYAGTFEARADEDWTASAHGSYLTFEYNPPGGTATETAMRLLESAVNGQTNLFIRRQAADALSLVQVQWKDGASIGAGDKVLILAS